MDFKAKIGRALVHLGIDPRKVVALRHLPQYYRQKELFCRMGGTITCHFPILNNYSDSAGTAKGHYFHQDLLVASLIHQHKPKRHIDVGSRVDGFVAHVAAFREIEVLDIRAMPPSAHANIKFRRADLMSDAGAAVADSVSCLHVIEHFGLGRYGDDIDPEGHVKGLQNLIRMVQPNGRLYLSFPIGRRDEIHFNAHRVLHPQTLLDFDFVKRGLELVRFDYVTDDGALRTDAKVSDAADLCEYGCGIYTFRRSTDAEGSSHGQH